MYIVHTCIVERVVVVVVGGGGVVPSTFKYIIYIYLYNCREINLQANMAGNFFGQTYFETHM